MSVVANAFWLAFCRIAADVLSFVLFAAISRTFGPAGTGAYSYAFAVASFVAIISTAGLEEYGLRQYARASGAERVSTWRSILLTQSAQASFALLIMIGYLVATGGRHASWVVVVALTVYLVSWNLSRVFYVPAITAQAMVVPAFTELSCRLGAIFIALALAFFGVDNLMLMLIGFPFCGLLLAWLSLRNAARHGATLQPARDWRLVLATGRGTLPFAASETLNQFYARTDLLLITHMLGVAQAGLYATNVKFVEVGVIPLVLLGVAAYPLLSRSAATDAPVFQRMARDLARSIFFLSGWLAVGIACLLPLLIVPLFGDDFAACIPLLHWFALLALMKGGEVTLYRLLYSVRAQNTYAMSLVAGTVLIIVLNYVLIPRFGLEGAIWAGILSIVMVVTICAYGIKQYVRLRVFASALVRLIISLAITAAAVIGMRLLQMRYSGLGDWFVGILACLVFPAAAVVSGLVPHPRHNTLFGHGKMEALEAVASNEAGS